MTLHQHPSLCFCSRCFYVKDLIFSSQQPCKAGKRGIDNPILQLQKLSLREGMKISCTHSASTWQRWDLNLDLLASQLSALPATAASRETLLCLVYWKPEEVISPKRWNRMKTQVALERVRKSWLTDPLCIAKGNWGCGRNVPDLGEQPSLSPTHPPRPH